MRGKRNLSDLLIFINEKSMNKVFTPLIFDVTIIISACLHYCQA